MKINELKKKKLYFLVAIFAMCLGVGLFFGGAGTTTAHAAAIATPSYSVPMTYSAYYKSNTATQTTGSGTTTSFRVRIGQYTYSTYSLSIYGSSASGTGTWNGYINSSTVTIALSSTSGSPKVTVLNSSGTTVGSGTGTFSLTGLSNGTYTGNFGASSGWLVNGRQYDSAGFSASFTFTVDQTAPTISGASTSTTGKYVNTSFTVSASDSGGSGLAALYYKSPGSSSYSSVASSKTFANGSANGLYYFYAKDNAGNTSSTYYVYHDNVKPTGVVKNASGTTLTSQYTNGSFSYTASDSGSGISYLQYLTPGSSSWTRYTAGTTIPANATNGKYQFRAVDKAGNISDVKTIYLDTVKPVGVLYSGTTAVSSGYKSTANYIKYVASDASSGIKTVYVKKPNASGYIVYTNGAQMTENGTYSFYCIDNIGNTSVAVSISLDNTKPTLSLSKGNFGDTLNDGFSVTATDNIGGTKLYYETPGGAFVESTSLTVTIPKTMENGRYRFYATDGYGNTSDIYSVVLSIDAPVGTIVKSSDGNQVCFIWTDNNCFATLNGESYVNGTWITTEGSHTLVLKNDANRSTTYSFSIDHYYKKKTTVAATCKNDGYTVYECDNCGHTYTTNHTAALGHNYVVTKEVESSCTAEGYSIYVCTRCGDTYNDDVVAANGHSFGSWYTIKDSDCLTSGIKRRDCVSCGAHETGEIEAKGHSYIATITEPACVDKGFTTHVCSSCGDNYIDTYTEATGHKYIAKITEPTCEERGYTTQTCKVCGDSYVENYVEPHGHDYGSWRITAEATCLNNGLRYKTCGTCKHKYNEVIPASGHDYEAEVVEPTCVDKGYTTHICSRCGTGYNDTFTDALGHDYKTKRIEPTCTEEGYIGQSCLRCGDTYKTQIIKAAGHDYVEEYIAVTCTEEGCVKHICLSCGYEYRTDVVSPNGHSLETHVLLASTCDEKGERYYGCTKCNYERIDEIPAKGHSYELAKEENNNGIIKRTYICSVCTDSYTQDMGAEYEKVSNYVEYLFNEYSPYMIWVFLATSGVWSVVMGIAIIIANKNEDKVKAKKMLVNYGIGLIVIFAILIACPYLVKGIAALVT